MKIKSPKDFWAGLMFIAFGVFFMIVAHNYRMGKVTSMGPAYFPTMLAGLLTVLGSILFFISLVVKGEKVSAIVVQQLPYVRVVAVGYDHPVGRQRIDQLLALNSDLLKLPAVDEMAWADVGDHTDMRRGDG